MKLAKFLNSLFIKNGFILIDADSNKYKIGNPKKENPITLRLLDRSLHSKLLFHPDLYFGEAYSNGSVVIENGSLTDFLEIAMKNIGRGPTSKYATIIKNILGAYEYITNFNLIGGFLIGLPITCSFLFASTNINPSSLKSPSQNLVNPLINFNILY